MNNPFDPLFKQSDQISPVRHFGHVTDIHGLMLKCGGLTRPFLGQRVAVEKVDGLRINKSENIDVMKHVVGGDLSLDISAAMARNNLEGLSLNALPADWANVVLAPKNDQDAYTGGIERLHSRPIKRLFKVTNFVACSCLAITQDGTMCNINADKIATQIAIGVKAHKLIFLSDVDGVKIGEKTAGIITAEQIEGYITDGTATGGMKVKLQNCKAALDAGVRRVHLLSGLREDALKKEIYEPVGPGTMLFSESERQSYENEVEAQKLIEGQK